MHLCINFQLWQVELASWCLSVKSEWLESLGCAADGRGLQTGFRYVAIEKILSVDPSVNGYRFRTRKR